LKNAFEACVWPGDALHDDDIDIDAWPAREHVKQLSGDNGRGFSDEETPFLMFFTPERRNSLENYSSGYDPPIAMRNLASHGGSLTIESREDEGTDMCD
jgi:K+-sensing histidine kinase KdpD